MIKAVFFDLDDTLLWDEQSIKRSFEETCKLAHKKYGVDIAQLEEKVREQARIAYATYDTYAFTQMIGINPFEGLWGNFLDEGEDFKRLAKIAPEYRKTAWTRGLLEVGIDDASFGAELAEAFPEIRKKHPLLYDDSLSTLEALKDKYKLVMITNGSPDLQQTKLKLTPELTPYFEEIIISGAFGRGKPDPTIFEFALEKVSVKKEEALMVGDNLNTDILGANRVGIPSVWLNRKGKLREENDPKPTYEITNLEELLPLMERGK